MRRKTKKKLKKIFKPYNIIVVLCICIIATSAYFLLKPEDDGAQVSSKTQTPTDSNEVKVVKSANKEVSEDEARALAVKQFKELKEKGVKKQNLEVIEFQRADEAYYYISSGENTVEIKKADGSITKINSIPVP